MKTRYTHGGDIYRHPAEYDFSVSINPLGMPLASVAAAHEGIVLCGRYPDPDAGELVRAIARAKQVPENFVIPGNGAAELLFALCRALPGRALTFAPTFIGYAEAMNAAGGCLRYVNPDDFFDTAGIAAMLADAVDAGTKLVFLCNPNNPTGALFTRDEILRVLAAAERAHAYVCVDECFLPFADAEDAISMISFVQEHPRLLVLRAFTKIYAMAGLRLGYLLCADAQLRTAIRRSLQPWNTSIPAQMAGIAALPDVEYLAKTREMLREERAYLVLELRRLADRIYDGHGNFLLLQANPEFGDQMLSEGVLVRSCADFEGLDERFYRIGIRSHSENQEFVRRMRKIRKETDKGKR